MSRVFDKISFAGLRLRNRIVRSATYEKRADEDGRVTDELVDLYTALADGGSGLIITGSAMVHTSGRTLRRMLCCHSNVYADGLKRLAGAVHDRGGLIALQLDHGGRQCPPLMLGGEQAMAPSEVHDPVTGATPRAMQDAEIWAMADAFGEAAFRAQVAGFDAVQVQAAHGTLISSFLSPHTNRRDDYWGGDPGRRMHFLEEALRSIRQAVGRDFPVIVKINADDMLPGGIKPDDAALIAAALPHMAADCIEVTSGMREARGSTSPEGVGAVLPEAYLRDASLLIRRATSLPVILTGGIRSLRVMDSLIAEAACDMIGMSRPLIMEPDLPRLMREGQERARCTSCNGCTRYSRLSRIECTLEDK